MLIPVRCWSCGKVIAHKYEEYQNAIAEGKDAGEVLDDLGFNLYCCRRMFVGTSTLSMRSHHSALTDNSNLSVRALTERSLAGAQLGPVG